MAPIRSQDAELVFDVTQAKHSGPSPLARGGGGDGGGGGGSGGGSSRAGAPKRVGTCRVSLRELADQREHDLPLTVLKKASWGQGLVLSRRSTYKIRVLALCLYSHLLLVSCARVTFCGRSSFWRVAGGHSVERGCLPPHCSVISMSAQIGKKTSSKSTQYAMPRNRSFPQNTSTDKYAFVAAS